MLYDEKMKRVCVWSLQHYHCVVRMPNASKQPSAAAAHKDVERVRRQCGVPDVESLSSHVWEVFSRSWNDSVTCKSEHESMTPVSGGMISPLQQESDIPVIRKAWSLLSSTDTHHNPPPAAGTGAGAEGSGGGAQGSSGEGTDEGQVGGADGSQVSGPLANSADSSPPESVIASCDMHTIDEKSLGEAPYKDVSRYKTLPDANLKSILKIPMDGDIVVQNKRHAEQELQKLQDAIELCEEEIQEHETARDDLNKPNSPNLCIHMPEHFGSKPEKSLYVNNMLAALKYQINTLILRKQRVQRLVAYANNEQGQTRDKAHVQQAKAKKRDVFSIKEMQTKVSALHYDTCKADEGRSRRREEERRLPSINRPSQHRAYQKGGASKPLPMVPSSESWNMRRSQHSVSSSSRRELTTPRLSNEHICALHDKEKQLHVEQHELQRRLYALGEERKRLDLGCQQREGIGYSYPIDVITLKEKLRYIKEQLVKCKKQKSHLIVQKEKLKDERKVLESKRKDGKAKLCDGKSLPKLNREKESHSRLKNLNFKQKIITSSMGG
jgi:hypothetical protein